MAAALAFGSAAAQPVRLVLVGDSTMATRTGYGDALCARLVAGSECWNLARGGRSSYSFRAEGLWDAMRQRLRDAPAMPTFVLIQFGHNDQPGKPGRSTELPDFSVNIARYVNEAREAGTTPVLFTPLTRRSFRDTQLLDDLRPWAEATTRVAQAAQAPLFDLHAASAALVQGLGSEEADTLAEQPPGQPRFDRTHLGAKGACIFANLVARGLAAQVPALAPHFQNAAACPRAWE